MLFFIEQDLFAKGFKTCRTRLLNSVRYYESELQAQLIQTAYLQASTPKAGVIKDNDFVVTSITPLFNEHFL